MSTTIEARNWPADGLPELLNAGSRLWHKSTPARIAGAAEWTNGSGGWAAWTRHLSRRRKPRSLMRIMPGDVPPLSWALAECRVDDPTASLIARLDEVARGAASSNNHRDEWTSPVRHWLADAQSAEMDTALGLESLAWCYALPALAGRLDARMWWELLEQLVQLATGAAEQSEAPALAGQLLGAELPLALAYLLPEIEPCRKLVDTARRTLSDSLVEFLDGEGLPHAGRFELLRPLLACWTRCRLLGANWKKGCWNDAAETQYEWLVRQALRTTRYDGRQFFASESTGGWCGELFDTALRQGGDTDDRRIARVALPGAKPASPSGRKLPSPSEHSEWAETCLLRGSWLRSSPAVAVLYDDCRVRAELTAGRDAIFSGQWDVEITLDGNPIRQTSAWEEICWFDEDEAVFLELEAEFDAGIRVQRQVLLARQDQFVYLADAVLGGTQAEIGYRARLPLAEGVEFTPADETREGRLATRRQKLLALPLALPEWRSDMRPGRLEMIDGALVLSEQHRGRCLYAPLFIDLSSQRRNKPLTWRQLTVAQDRVIQARDTAVGYRVQIGKRQWIVYRSLAAAGNRTVLGQNLIHEFTVGRFDRDGQLDALVEVE